MSETMKDFENELEASFKKIEEGDVVTGTVSGVDEKEVTVDLNYYAEGIIPVNEYSRVPGFSVKDDVQVGTEVTAVVLKKDNGRGNILLSKVRADEAQAWEKLEALKESGENIEVTITGIVKGGAVAFVEGIRGFIPASRLAAGRVDDIDSYLKKTIQVRAIEVDKANNKKLILSAREIEREKEREERNAKRAKRDEARKEKAAALEIGAEIDGVVESFLTTKDGQEIGAFIKIAEDLTGLLHVSQISEKRVAKPSDALTVGDEVKVRVTAVKDGKISLTMKKPRAAAPVEAAEGVKEESGYADFKEYQKKNKSENAVTTLGSLFAGIKLD